ncbi:MAG: 23S rRNA (uracil(1939)-C(5))-methyltransferase RlmD [Desulfobacterales bacterium]|nr:23S rRNA (uracil(1939)-C(5))-methyltransferase RlmD [Desulfobacterales bacterium]
MKKGQELTLEVTDIAFGGRGLAKPDGFAVFVDGALAGDTVRARVFKKKKSYAEARAVEILAPSADRVQPPCPYSGTCGGCKWQFVDYPAQCAFKRRHVAEALSHIGQIHDVPVAETIPSERIFGYRNKMEFTCSDRRWLLSEELGKESVQRDFAVGLHVPGTFDKVMDTRVCLLMPELGNRLLEAVRGFIRNSGVPVYGLRSHQGYWRFVMLRHSVSLDQWMVNIVTSDDRPELVQPLADDLRSQYPAVVSVVNNITARKAGIAVGEKEVLLSGAPVIEERVGGLTFEVSANSFFQTNTRGAETLYNVAADFAGLTGTEQVLDLYCGTGTIAMWLSKAAAKVTGIEMVESAVADAERNCRRNGIDNCRFIRGDIRDVLTGFGQRPEVVIIDPPRVGMHKDVVEQLLVLLPKRIVYVSCNPATLARDLGLLAEAYRTMEVQPVDLFPHTFHVEAVARLERR